MEIEEAYREWKHLINQLKEISKRKKKLREFLDKEGAFDRNNPKHCKDIQGRFSPTRKERNLKMISMYKEGKTLQEIGDSYGFTREYIRQILKRNGIASIDGGNSKKKKIERDIPCKVDGCVTTGSKTKGFCATHYMKFMNHGDPLYERKTIWKGKFCIVENCGLPMKGNHLCNKHNVNYITNLKNGNISDLDDFLEVQKVKQMLGRSRGVKFSEIREIMKRSDLNEK